MSENWTFFTNHGHVLVCLLQNPSVTVRKIALRVGITERAVQRIIGELEEAGVVVRQRVGRRNRYAFDLDRPLRHPLEAHRTLREVLAVLVDRKEA